MKMPKEVAQKLMFEALFKHDGDRAAAAKELGVSLRTFYRHLGDYDMYPMMDRLNWTKNPGPPRGEPKGSSVIRMRIMAHIKKHRGKVDYGKLAEELYGSDTTAHRQRVYSALEAMKKLGRVRLDGDAVWSLVPSAMEDEA